MDKASWNTLRTMPIQNSFIMRKRIKKMIESNLFTVIKRN